ncbi:MULTISPECIES: lytic transglycosylase domain-containing protein [Chryseobacterium]|jgi:membrane-bound lytic murein transglycosylase D|uniref:lytic transglycosylase domain-containing protein n=1 Tax=Chryseobacterium TaxID=59732 RepID=UPI000C9E586A|nr:MULTISPECIES: lytic transglycosylase domain-containing protein [Chryseobacterium]VXB11722.1 Membrane-bound lytic murein transglycosylase D [Chryseobacterium sp. 8AT]
MKPNFKNIILSAAFLGCSHFVNAQFLAASDTSESSVRKYKNIIESNKEVVTFIEFSMVEKGLPKHLRNLALIESHFNRNITSHAGAVGVWQFMTAHANQYGLTEDRRNDLYRSTKTAAVSLKNLYKKYNNWVTVVAAYNCGEGNIAKAMQAANSTQYHVFSKYLPAETINHVKKYLNACYATGELPAVLANYNDARTISLLNSRKTDSQEIALSETEINAGFKLGIIAEELKIDMNDLLSWNPEIVSTLENDGESKLFLPTDLMPDFLMKKNAILSKSIRTK